MSAYSIFIINHNLVVIMLRALMPLDTATVVCLGDLVTLAHLVTLLHLVTLASTDIGGHVTGCLASIFTIVI